MLSKRIKVVLVGGQLEKFGLEFLASAWTQKLSHHARESRASEERFFMFED
jgi:hypothetical protein